MYFDSACGKNNFIVLYFVMLIQYNGSSIILLIGI